MVKEVLYIGIAVIIFSVLHSITASPSFKNKIRALTGNRFYEGWFRFLYNIFSVISLLPVLYFTIEPSPIIWQVHPWMAMVFQGIRIMAVIGIMISLWQIDWHSFIGIRQLHDFFTKQDPSSSNEVLVTTGIYSITRHPLYLFSLIFIWLTPVMTSTWLAFSIGSSLYFFIGSYLEEKKMLRQYGTQYKEYQESVPWLIPFLKINKSYS